MPRLMRLTGGRFAWLLPFPAGVIATRDARNGNRHRRVVIYCHDGERITVIPSKAGLSDDPFWYQNALADPAVLFESQSFRAEVIEDEAGGSVVTPAQPPPHLVRVVTQLVEREPAGGA